MAKPPDPDHPDVDLRDRAEALLKSKAAVWPGIHESLLSEGAQRAIHELQVHQIELELQNEELRRTHLELETAQARYFDLYNLAPVGYCTLSSKGLVLEANQTAASLLKVQLGELINQPFTRFMLPEDADSIYLRHRQRQAGSEAQSWDVRMQRSPDTIFWANLNTTVVEDSEGKAVIRLVFKDITDRKRSEIMMLSEQERTKAIIETIGNPVFVKDNDHRIVLANHAFYEAFGLPESAVIGKTLAEKVPVDEMQHFLAVDRQVLDTGKPARCEETLTTNGMTRHIITTKTRFIDEAGSRFLVCAIQDMTDQRRMDNALLRMTTVVDQSPLSVLITDPSGAIEYVNQKFTDLTGYAAAEVLGQNPSFLKAGGLPSEVYKKLWDTLHAGGTWCGEFLNKKKNGELFWEEATISPLRDSTGTVTHFVALKEDITKRKAIAAALAEMDEQLRLFVEHSPAAIAMLDTNMTYLLASRRWLEDYHLSNEVLVGRSHYEVFPDIPQRWREIHQRCLAGAVEKCDRDPFPRADGTTDWVRWEIRPWTRSDGTIGGLLILSEVVTERVRAQEDKLQQQAMLARTEEIAKIGSWELEVATGDVSWSDEMFRILGLNSADGTPPFTEHGKLFSPESLALIKQGLEATERDGIPYELEVRALRPDGTVRICLSRGFPDAGPDGKIRRIYGSFQDITERKRAEEARDNLITELDLTNAELNATLQSLPFLVSLHGKDGHYRKVNATVIDTFGFDPTHASREEIALRLKARFPDGRPFTPANLPSNRALTGETIHDIEYLITDTKGDHHTLLINAVPLIIKGELQGSVFAQSDITLLRRTQEASQQLQAMLARTESIAQIGSWEWSVATGTMTWSEEMFRILQRNPADGVPTLEQHAEFHAPEDVLRIRQAIESAVNQGLSYELELFATRSNGEVRICQSHGFPEFDSEGVIRRVFGSLQDITERKHAEIEIQRSKGNLVKAQHYARVGSWTWHIKTGRLEWSKEMYRLFGIAEETFSGELTQVVAQAIHPEDRDAVNAANRVVAETGRSEPLEYRILLPDGTCRTVWAEAGELELDADGKPATLSGIVQDITERKVAEQALRESKEVLSQFISQAPIYAFIKEVTPTQSQMIYASKNFEEFFGKPHAEFIGRPMTDLFPAEMAQKLTSDDWAVVSSGKGQNLNQEFNGRIYSGYKFQILHKERHLLAGFSIDITEQELSKDRLAASHEQLRTLLARLQRAQEDERLRVSREIHDEMGQLLTGLKMDVRWLERKLSEPGLPLVLNPLLDRVVGASELVDAMLATVQRIAAELRPNSIAQLGLDAALGLEVGRFEERSGIPCSITRGSALPSLPSAIATDLFYICREALTNVGRHARATKVEVAWYREGDMAVLTVCDNGVGMDPGFSATSNSLGLVGMKERAIQCGGSVTFAQGAPSGTVVMVHIPCSPFGDEGSADR